MTAEAPAQAEAGTSTDLITRRSCIASNASRQPSSGARRPTIVSGCVTPLVEQVDHALPDGVVVAERSLQADVAQHERVDVHGDDVRRPADLDDLPVRARQPQRGLERAARAGRVAHESAPSGVERAHELLRDSRRSTFTTCVAPSARAALEPRLVAVRPATISGLAPDSAAIRAHSRPIGPGPEHDHSVARADRRVDAHRVVRDRMRLGQAREVERQRVGDAVQAARRHAHVRRHRAVDRRSRSPCATGTGCSGRRGTSGTRRRSAPPSR